MSRTIRTARGAAAIAAVSAAALALSSCSGGSEGTGGSGDGAPDTSSLVIGLEGDMAPFGYDPLRYSTGQRFFYEGMYDALFVAGEDGRPVPSAATDFSFNDDYTEMTLELDTSLTFDDGTALTADLVEQNLAYRDDEELVGYGEFGEGGETEIADVVVVDDDTVTLVFAAPQPGFEGNLTFPAGAIVGPEGLADRASLASAPDGSGPLTIDAEATVKGSSYVQVKKDDAARADDYPFDSYEFRPVVDPQARSNSIISGEVDLSILSADTVPQVEGSGVTVTENGGTIYNLIAFDKAGALDPAFGDPAVARAISLAIDREAYVAAVHPGQKPTANVMPADAPGYIAEFEDEYAYDPEAARDVLAEAGHEDGLSFEFTITSRSQRDLEALQPYLADVGIDITLNMASSTEEQFASVRTNPWGGPFSMNWSNPLGNVNGVLFGFANFHGGEAPEIQAASAAYGSAQDDAARAEALTELNRAIVEAGWLIPLYEEFFNWGYSDATLAEPIFAGADPYPILASLQPAS